MRMLTYNEAFYQAKEQLRQLYDPGEGAAIVHLFLEYITGYGKLERLDLKNNFLTRQQQELYDSKLKELLRGTPVQYVTNRAWFSGNEYFVNGSVLIPRPETEELVQWILGDIKNQGTKVKNILDIGTGSGCIPVSLKLAMPEAEVTSCDISTEALGVANINAGRLKAQVRLMQIDFLDAQQHNNLSVYDVIVSNPPYIPAEEKARLHNNVKDYEPALALFVPDNDALVFYRAIAGFGKGHLSSNGYIYCELDAGHAEECKALFEQAGYTNVELKKDMHDNWRMLRATLI